MHWRYLSETKTKNRFNKAVLCFFFILFSLNCRAQFAGGFRAGYTNNHMNASLENLSYTQNRNGNGMGFDILLQYRLNKRLALASSVGLLKRKYSFYRY